MSAPLIGWLLAIGVTVVVVGIHAKTVSWVHVRRREKRPLSPTVLITVLFVAHFVESACYGLGYFIGSNVFEIGDLIGATEEDVRHYLYFSLVTYTSLGLGDVLPTGELRLLSGLEVLTGLLMIGWSAALLFAEMLAQEMEDME